ncbi:PTS sugar transporter subunit IIA [Vibrio sp. JC009]|uniref:PTS sugar transporter subunit IIA n=1 Tax=Vibrio sp. JC009 TaxID=2912314 RepID=UPI0023AEE002|nr:PTS sugar transporter subunit IIA [Vibrio sp. JC009]WED23443.1 PTS sugar transporter subunit IIA [Vibrio sp. JC009]
MLYEMLKNNLVKVKVEAGDKYEAVQSVGQLMLDGGFIESRYIDAMIQTVKDEAQYIVITKNVAMPHARPEQGVKKVCASVITLAEPVIFGHEENDPVKLIIALAATDSTSHIELIQDIAEVFDDEELIEKLINSETETEFLELIKSKVNEGAFENV